MTPEERLKQNEEDLIHQTGWAPEDTVKPISKKFGNLANRADKLQDEIQEMEWGAKFGKPDD